MSDTYPKFFTVDEAARILGVEPARVRNWQLKKGLVTPVLTKGRLQFDRAALARMAVLVRLQDVFGVLSEFPAQVVRERAEVIDHALDDLDRDFILVVVNHGEHGTYEIKVPLTKQLRDAIAAVPA